MPNYFYDANHVRYDLAASHKGEPYNWLFFPGGPGADSRYFYSLLELLQLPGNTWLVDMPGNGDNTENISDNYSYDQWLDIFPAVIEKFPNPILIGHSFGAMLAFLTPEMENALKGFVVLNSAPCLWTQEAVEYAKQYGLPDLSAEMQAFTLNPNPATFSAALEACMPYYFPKDSLEKGKALLSGLPFRYQAAAWAQSKLHAMNYSAKWVPQQVPTLVVGGTHDCIVPHYLFKRDKRFERPNIEMVNIENGGHLGWIENPKALQRAFAKFSLRL